MKFTLDELIEHLAKKTRSIPPSRLGRGRESGKAKAKKLGTIAVDEALSSQEGIAVKVLRLPTIEPGASVSTEEIEATSPTPENIGAAETALAIMPHILPPIMGVRVAKLPMVVPPVKPAIIEIAGKEGPDMADLPAIHDATDLPAIQATTEIQPSPSYQWVRL